MLVSNEQEHDHRGNHARKQRGQPRAGDTKVAAVDQHRVDGNVNNVHDQRRQQRDARIAHGAKQRGAGIVNREKRV